MTKDEEITQLRRAIEAGEARWLSQIQEIDRLKIQLIEAQRVFLDMYNEKNDTIFKLRRKLKKLRGEGTNSTNST